MTLLLFSIDQMSLWNFRINLSFTRETYKYDYRTNSSVDIIVSEKKFNSRIISIGLWNYAVSSPVFGDRKNDFLIYCYFFGLKFLCQRQAG